jgi:hypothetical protein
VILHPPFMITSRLMAGLRVGDATIGIEYGDWTVDGRMRYLAYLDLADGREFEIDDLQSGVGGGNLAYGMENLLGFLEAAGEARNYHDRTGRESENEDLFEPAVGEWAQQNLDELATARNELTEDDGRLKEGLIEE